MSNSIRSKYYVGTLLTLLMFIATPYTFSQPCNPCVAYFEGNENTIYIYPINIVADNSGNIFVTGSILNSGNGFDWGTVKYDAYLNQLGSQVFNGATSQNDIGNYVAVDSNGNVIVAGASMNIGGKYDWYVKSYSNDLSTVNWTSTYSYSGYNNVPYAVAIDANNNVYVTGLMYDANTLNGGIGTVKYTSSGSTVWRSNYPGEYGYLSYGIKMTLDNQGTPYVTGRESTSAGYYDMVTISYIGSAQLGGQIRWVKSYAGSGYGAGTGYDIKCENSNARNIYVTGEAYENVGGTSTAEMTTIKYSTDGTQKWVEQEKPDPSSGGIAQGMSIDLYTTPCDTYIGCTVTHVYVVGSIYISGDGQDIAVVQYDQNGSKQWMDTYNGSGTGDDGASQVNVRSDQAGYAYVSGTITNSSGVWQYINLVYDFYGTLQTPITSPWSPDNGTIYAHTTSGTIYEGVDGGGSNYFGFYTFGLAKFSPIESYATIVYTSSSELLPSNVPNDISSSSMLNADTGYVAGNNGLIMRTINGGKSWNAITTSINKNLNSISFLNSSLGVAVGDSGAVLITSNGGSSWSATQTGTSTRFNHIMFYGEGSAVILADNGNILRTTDAGSSWTTIQNVTSSSLRAASFSGSSNGIVVGNSGTALVTNNGGANWSAISAFTGSKLRAVQMTSAQEIIAVGDSGAVFYSSNSGTNWVNRSYSTMNNLNAVYFVNPDTGYAGGDKGLVLFTTNRGVNWSVQYEFVSKDVRSMTPYGANHILATGSAGLIMKSAIGGGQHSVSKGSRVNKLVPQTYSLLQNYPNPFNPSTSIRYSIPKDGNVSLRVYNALGQLVSTLASGYHRAGDYNVSFDGMNYSSGIYFYRLESGNFSQVKKMVLIK